MKHCGCTVSSVESSVLRIEASDLDRANQIGVNIATYVELRQLGIPHSLSIRILDFDSEEVDISQFLNESAGLTDKQKADVATGRSVCKFPLRNAGWSFELEYDDLMTMCFRLIKIGVDSAEAPKISSKTLKALEACKGFGYLVRDEVLDAVVSVGRLKVNLQLDLKNAIAIVSSWLDLWEDCDGVPQFSDRASLVIELETVFSIPKNLTVDALCVEFNDFELLTDYFIEYCPDGKKKVKDAEDELLAFTPVDLLVRYPELFAAYIENRVEGGWSPEGPNEVLFSLGEEILKLEGFLIYKDF
jgi:hypothetical protein